MYIDPNVGGMLFQSLAAIFAAVATIIFLFARQIRTGIAWIRRQYFNRDNRRISRKGK